MGQNNEQEKGRFLTDTQRDYLQGEHEPPTNNAEYQLRSKIRHRTKGAIYDLAIVARNLSQKDRSLLLNLETPRSTDAKKEKAEMPDGTPLPIPTDNNTEYGLWGWVGFSREINSIIRFYYKTLREIDSEEQSFAKTNITSLLEYTLERAEREYLGLPPSERFNIKATVEVETTTYVNIEKAKRRFQSGKDLRPIELKALAESGEVDIQLAE